MKIDITTKQLEELKELAVKAKFLSLLSHNVGCIISDSSCVTIGDFIHYKKTVDESYLTVTSLSINILALLEVHHMEHPQNEKPTNNKEKVNGIRKRKKRQPKGKAKENTVE